MGTRADFWVRNDKGAEWVGSVGWDGYQWDENPECFLMQAKTEQEFRVAVRSIQLQRTDFSCSETGWPWPWKNSVLTDYSYVFEDGRTQVYCFGSPVGPDGKTGPKATWFPDMATNRHASNGNRSGLIVVGQNGIE
jgi:hypothetical protein